MFGLTPEFPFKASLWIRSGYDVKVEVSAQTYQVGAHFKALNEAVLVASMKTLENFLSFEVSLTRSGTGLIKDMATLFQKARVQ